MAALINDLISVSGFEFDNNQRIFFSRTDAWQRNFGYFALYDEAAPFAACFIHCEPIKFEYGGKNWNIELWKGQYGICVGAEIGIYTGSFKIDNPIIDRQLSRLSPGGDTQCAGVEDWLRMSFKLKKKNGEILFTRDSDNPGTLHKEEHWWLTGFKPGFRAAPSDLINEIKIHLKDSDMVVAFVEALSTLGYRSTNITIDDAENSVKFDFDNPLSPQPSTSWVLDSYEEIYDKIQDFIGRVFDITRHTIIEVGLYIHEFYRLGKNYIAKILKRLGYSIFQIGRFLMDLLNASALEVGQALKYAGYRFVDIVEFINDNFNMSNSKLAKLLKSLGYSIRTIALHFKDLGYIELVKVLRNAEFRMNSIIRVISRLFNIPEDTIRLLF